MPKIERSPDSCALVAAVYPYPVDCQGVLDIQRNLNHRAGPLGAGIAAGIWNEELLTRTALRNQLTPDFSENNYVITTWSYSPDVATSDITRKLQEMGVMVWLTEEIHTNPNALNPMGLDSRPNSIVRLFATIDNHETKSFDPNILHEEEFGYLADTLAAAQKEYFSNHQVYVPSFTKIADNGLGGGVEIFKGVGTLDEIYNFYEELHEAKSILWLTHQRFPTLTRPWWLGSHPFQGGRFIGMHNGNIISYDIHKDTLEKYYAFQAGTDSEALPAMMDYLTRVGNLPVDLAMTVLKMPQWDQRRKFTQAEQDVLEALNITFDDMTPDGPASLIMTDGSKVYAFTGRHGVRPLHVTRRKTDGTIFIASELGPISQKTSTVSRGKVHTKEEIVVYVKDREVIVEELNIRDSIATTAENNKIYPVNIYRIYHHKGTSNGPMKKDGLENRRLHYLHNALTQFGCSTLTTSRLGKEAISGAVRIESTGRSEPLAIWRGENVRFEAFLRLGASEVGDPSIDPDRMPIDTITHLGERAKSIYEVPDKQYKQVVLESPILFSTRYLPSSWIYLKETLSNAAKSFGTAILAKEDSSESLPSEIVAYLTTRLENNFGDSVSNLFRQVETQIDEGKSIIVLSDIVINNNQDIIPATLMVRLVDQYLKEKNIRHRVSLVVESLEIVSSAAVVKTIALGADAVSLDPRIVLASMGVGKYELRSDPLEYNGVDPDEAHIRAHNLFTSWTHQIKKLMGGADLTDINNLRGNRTVLHSTGLGDLAEVLDITDDGIGTRSPEFFIRRNVMAFNTLQFQRPVVLPKHNDARFAAGIVRHIVDKSSRIETPRTDYFDLLEFRDIETSTVSTEKVSLTTKLYPSGSLGKNYALPIVFGAVSYGAGSTPWHEIVGDIASERGLQYNTGEGGRPLSKFSLRNEIRWDTLKRFLSEDEWTAFQVASGRFGISMEVLRHAGIIEIKIAQGAKPGIGGHLPGIKVSEAVAVTRGIPEGSSAISPATHQDITSIEDLRALISLLREATGGKTPIQVKLAALPGMEWIAIGAARCGADALVIDGDRGSTGAAPWAQQNEVGISVISAIAKIDDALRKEGIRENVSLIGGGGLRTVKEFLMLIALGADSAMVVTPFFEAMSCNQCGLCHLGNCPKGITAAIGSQAEENLRYDEGKEMLNKYLDIIEEEMKLQLAKLGLTSIDQLVGRRDILRLIAGPEILAVLDPSLLYEMDHDYSYLATPLLMRPWIDGEVGQVERLLDIQMPALLSESVSDLDIYTVVSAIDHIVNMAETPGITQNQSDRINDLFEKTSSCLRQSSYKHPLVNSIYENLGEVMTALESEDNTMLVEVLDKFYNINSLTKNLKINRVCGCLGPCIHRELVKGTSQDLIIEFRNVLGQNGGSLPDKPVILDLSERPMAGDRYVGVSLTRMLDQIREETPDWIQPVEVILSGVAGHDFAALTTLGMSFRVVSRDDQITGAQDGVGKSSQGGEIIIEGNVGDVAGYGMRGGRIYISGSADDLLGANIRGFDDTRGPVIVVGGGVKNRACEGVMGGTVIIVGKNLKDGEEIVGENLASGVVGGKIFVHATVEEVVRHIHKEHQSTLNIEKVSFDWEDEAVLREELGRWCQEFGESLYEISSGDWTKITSTTVNPLARTYGAH